MGNSPSSLQRVAFSPGEFAALFGKQQTWGYRQLYSGKVKAITEHGRLMIPAAEVERVLATAGIYDGAKAKPLQTKADIQKLAPKLKDAWQRYVARRRDGEAQPAAKSSHKPLGTHGRLPWEAKGKTVIRPQWGRKKPSAPA